MGKRGRGKALAVDTPLPTPTGWTTMGDVRVGDVLFDERGERCRVTAVKPIYDDHECFRVRFSDGEEIVADAAHLWLTEDRASRQSDHNVRLARLRRRSGSPIRSPQRRHFPALRTTAEIAATLTRGRRGDWNHAVALTDAGQELAVPPVYAPTDERLQAMVYEQVGPAREQILRRLVEIFPAATTKADLAAELGVHERTKTYLNNLGSLRTLGFVCYPRSGQVAATTLMFVNQGGDR